MNRGSAPIARIGILALMLLVIPVVAFAQTKPFIPVEGASLKAKIDGAITAGHANAPNGRFWIGYQFEVRPGVAVDFEVVNGAGVYVWSDDAMSSDPRYETRELGLFMLYDTQREQFIRADVYNLKRNHEYSNYPVYWAGRINNEESLNYLKSMVDLTPDPNALASRALYVISLHDDARVDAMLIEFVRRPVVDALRTRAINLLGTTPESQAKNTLLTEIARTERETGAARQAALGALAMSRSAALLPVFQNLYETLLEHELKRLALRGISRSDNADAAATYLIHVADTEKDQDLRKSAIANLGRVAGPKSLNALTATLDGPAKDVELQKTAVTALARRPKDEAIPILIRTARNHPSMEVRKTAIRVLGQTGDERAIALFSELLSKD